MKYLIAAMLLLPGLAIAETLFEGQLEQNSFFTKLEGDWQVVQEAGQTRIVFADNFAAKKAPDLKIFLSSKPFADINGDNAADQQHAVLVSELTSYKGNMAFTVPEGISVADYQSLIVHCEQYAKLWGGASLR